MRARLTVLSVLIAPSLIAGCGTASKVAPQPTVSAGQVKPQVGPGTLMTDALTEARCTDDGAGVWTASGVIQNTTKKARAYDVTIYIGPPDGQRRPAQVTHVDTVPAGKSAPWSAPTIVSDAPDGPCHIQVRVAK